MVIIGLPRASAKHGAPSLSPSEPPSPPILSSFLLLSCLFVLLLLVVVTIRDEQNQPASVGHLHSRMSGLLDDHSLERVRVGWHWGR